MHPVIQLYDELDDLGPYPDGMRQVPSRWIEGTAFFPGGAGLIRSPGQALEELSSPTILVVGQDFDTYDKFCAARRVGTENVPGNPTWWQLNQPWREEAGLVLTKCFFTNLFMGLRCGSGATGRSPALSNPAFAERCVGFLGRQIELLQPRLILTLGKRVPAFLAELFPEDLSQWRDPRAGSSRSLDRWSASTARMRPL